MTVWAARVVAVLLALTAALAPACRQRPPFGYDFESDRALDELPWSCGTLFRISGEHATAGQASLEIRTFPPAEGVTEHYPGVSFFGFAPDWSGHRALAFDAHNPEGAPLPLEVRIDDRESSDYGDRYNATVTLAAGDNRVVIPFARLVTSGTGRALDTRKIRAVTLFLVNPRERHTLYLDRVRLE